MMRRAGMKAEAAALIVMSVGVRAGSALALGALMCGAGVAWAQPDLSQGAGSFDTALPTELEVKRAPTGHLLVKPVINGVGDGWFIFDTGAGICVISTPHRERYGLAEAGNIEALGVGGGEGARLWRAAEVRLGPMTLRDHPLMETDLSFLKQYLGEEIVGVVGFGVLSRCVAEIAVGDGDRPARIALHDPEAYTLTGGAWVELDLADRVPAVRAKYLATNGGEEVEALFRLDTGANGSVTFHQPAVERHGLAKGEGLSDAKLGGVGGFVAAKVGTLAWFELGGVRSEGVRAKFALEPKGTFADARKEGNIGADLLRPFTLVLDYAGRRAAFRRPE